MRLRSAVIAVATAATVLLGACSGGSDQSSPPAESPSAPTTSTTPMATPSDAPSASASDSAESAEPSAAEPGTAKVSAADGALTWTMPCAEPRDQDIRGNEQDKKRYSSFHGWACGTGASTTAAVFLVQLVKTPQDEDAAHRELEGAAEEVFKGSKPKHGTFQGHPSVTMNVTQNGETLAFRGVSFDDYLVLFVARPADALDQLTDTVEISS